MINIEERISTSESGRLDRVGARPGGRPLCAGERSNVPREARLFTKLGALMAARPFVPEAGNISGAYSVTLPLNNNM